MDHLPNSTLDLSYHHRPAGHHWAVSDVGDPHQTWCWLSFLAWPQTCLITTCFPEDLDLSGTWQPWLALPCSPCLGTRELGRGWQGPCSAGCGTPSAPRSPSLRLRHKLLLLSNLISTGIKRSRQKSPAVCFKQVPSVDNQETKIRGAAELSLKLRGGLKRCGPSYEIYLPCSPEQLSGHLAPIQPKAPVFLLRTGFS